MTVKIFAFSTIFLLANLGLKSQSEIQWAHRILGFSSQLNKTAHTAKQALGEPTKLFTFGHCGCAWAPKTHKEDKAEYIKVAFKNAQPASRIFVVENYNPVSYTHLRAHET